MCVHYGQYRVVLTANYTDVDQVRLPADCMQKMECMRTAFAQAASKCLKIPERANRLRRTFILILKKREFRFHTQSWIKFDASKKLTLTNQHAIYRGEEQFYILKIITDAMRRNDRKPVGIEMRRANNGYL